MPQDSENQALSKTCVTATRHWQITLPRILPPTAFLLALSLAGCGSGSGSGSSGGGSGGTGSGGTGSGGTGGGGGSNIYMVGDTSNSTGGTIATYWKNGTATNLSDLASVMRTRTRSRSTAAAMSTWQADIYNLPTQQLHSDLLEERHGHQPNRRSDVSLANAIAVDSSGNVYVAGATATATGPGRSDLLEERHRHQPDRWNERCGCLRDRSRRQRQCLRGGIYLRRVGQFHADLLEEWHGHKPAQRSGVRRMCPRLWDYPVESLTKMRKATCKDALIARGCG